MIEKNTIKKEIHLSGIGIHSGKKVNLLLRPSSSGGIIFRRTDLDNLELALDPEKIETKSSTYLLSEECKIQTLEHLLAALYMFGLDSLTIEIDGDEIPIMDGSAAPFAQAILEAGIMSLPAKKKSIRVIKPFSLEEKDAVFSFSPDSDFKITYSIEYDHPAIQRQELSLSLNLENFLKEIAPARTFGFLKDVPALRAQGLAAGGSLDNAVVLDEKSVISGPLRYPDEFVRHSLHLKAIHFLLDNPEFWTYI
jgi:UDP-3-O-[3-hydroxymyristoyl] N-acetylglucosamine deacetylase